ncbi:phosphotransferase [Cytobacillus sp. FSL R7-0696]|uniref:phosphotransferase n=1 Tax=Cytobacillus sp. FSL R7-0696 TaxID=2921691 RepID=UPI0030F6F3AC
MNFYIMKDILNEQFDLKITHMTQLTDHNISATYYLNTAKGSYVLKRIPSYIQDTEIEGKLVKYLYENEIPVAQVIKSNQGTYSFSINGEKYHLQEYIDGEIYDLNNGTDWFKDVSAQNLGKIQHVLSQTPKLKTGMINKELFTNGQIIKAKKSYLRTFKKAQQSNDTTTMKDIINRLEYLDTINNYTFDYSKFTCTNSHGDYYTSQIICKETKLYTIDWTDACHLPACWEVMMSFAYADPVAKSGKIESNAFKRYIDNYSKWFTLTKYDLFHMPYLYFFQLAVSNFYEPYGKLPKEYLKIARLTTKQLAWLNKNVDSLAMKLV